MPTRVRASVSALSAHWGVLALSAALCWTNVARACSGEGASELIDSNEALAARLFLLCLALLPVSLLAWRKNPLRGIWVVAHVALLVMHPHFWVDSLSGDCGSFLAETSILFCVVAVLGVGWVGCAALRSKTVVTHG